MQPVVGKLSFVHADFFVLRTPILPISQLVIDVPHTLDESRSAALRHWLSKPYVVEALFLASPTLWAEIEPWLDDPASFLPALVENTIWKYLLRMSSRATPFGLFAGYVVGQLTDHTSVELAADKVQTVTRLDRAVMAQLIHQSLATPEVRHTFAYKLNNSWYRVGQQHRYSEYVGEGDQRTVQLTSLADNVGVQAVLNSFAQSSDEKVLFADLVEAVANLGFEKADAEAFIAALIDAQFLVSELAPRATGTASDAYILDLLRASEPAHDLPALCTGPPALSTLQRMHSLGKPLSGTNSYLKTVLQTDANWKTDRNGLNQAVVRQMGEQLTRLMVLRSDRLSQGLTSFRNRFHERFGEQTVPLLLALDPDVGVGYGQSAAHTDLSLLNGLIINRPVNNLSPTDRLDTWRITKLAEALRAGQGILTLTDEDLNQLSGSAPTTPPARSWYAHGTLLAESAKAIDQGNYYFQLRTAAGPSALNLMGRFASHDDILTDHLRQWADWEQEEHPDAILAEIVHLPTDRIGNVVSRPALRSYEIPYLTHPSVKSEYTILLSDLVVSTPRGQEIILYSKRLSKRVLPRLATAHNFHRGDDVYRFLCDLQHHDQTTQLSWSWGALQDQPKLPRVVYEQIILARAQWTIRRAQLPTNVAVPQLIAQLRAELGIPRWVAVMDGDNELVLDLDVPLCGHLLVNELTKRDITVLTEWLATPDQCWVRQGEHRFTSEIVLPFGFKVAVPTPSFSFRQCTNSAIQRVFPPGSEWLYLKLYASESVADELLTRFIGPLAEELLSTHVIGNWFFVRYADPDPHLRIRFYCPQRTYAYLLDQFNAALAKNGLSRYVSRVQVDTYERELERYGYSAIEPCEVLFGLNSQAIVAWLTAHEGCPDEAQRWLFACQQVEAILTLFALSLPDKLALLRSLQQAYLTEQGGSKALKKQLNDHYRQWTELISQALNEQAEWQRCEYDSATSVAQTIVDIIKNQSDGNNQLISTITSVLHMALNRVFPGKQRQAELVVYHFMTRYFESINARLTKTQSVGRGVVLHFTE